MFRDLRRAILAVSAIGSMIGWRLIAGAPPPALENEAAAVGTPDVCEPAPPTTQPSNPPKTARPLPTLRPYVDEITFPPRRAKPVVVVAANASTGAPRTEHYRIEMLLGQTQLHSDIPKPTPIFGYDGSFPGPTFDVHHKTKVFVEWANNINVDARVKAGLPAHILSTIYVEPKADSLFPQDWPGTANAKPSTVFGPAPIWTVVHLHGGSTMPGSDGYPDDAYPPGDRAVYAYDGQPRASLLWYHDHADMITRLNVQAGLAGMYIVRDEVEDALKLPRGGRHELPLLIQDRNLDVDDATGAFTGAMIEKLAADGAEFYGPYTLVNGRIWPFARVEPRQLRLRLVNGSNGRFYRLKLKDDSGATTTAKFTQIGTDSGLLDGPVKVPGSGLTLAPAERADVILDLSDYAGKNVTLVNDYPIPMAPLPPASNNVSNKPIHEEVIQFRVADRCESPDDLKIPADFRPYFPGKKSPRLDPSTATLRRPIYLIEDPPGTLTLNGRLFHDRVEEIVHLGDTEIWEIINTTGDFHPFHMHLVDFEVLERQQFAFDPASTTVDTWVGLFRTWQNADPTTRPQYPPGIKFLNAPCRVDDNEKGLKDTFRTGPMTVTRILVKFGPHTGRYVYHCHILEHEDMEMMRPYLILPQGLDSMSPNTGPGTIPIGTAKMAAPHGMKPRAVPIRRDRRRVR